MKIEIDQGKKARIKQIQFIGDKKIKDKRLLEVIASEEHKFWKFISRKVYLNQSLINLDKKTDNTPLLYLSGLFFSSQRESGHLK